MTRIDQRLQTVRLSRSAGVGRSLHRDPAGLDRPSPFLNFGLDEFLQIFRRAALARDEIGADLLHPRLHGGGGDGWGRGGMELCCGCPGGSLWAEGGKTE